ncbi:ROK family protein [Algivirga pacifica]|uniref:ROK family protein n=1 Tax=Algivirga pacifica TaxID=1162670 RepID=A0ABP9DK70_9BACT
MKLFLGIDVGGTNVKVGLVDEKGEIIKKKKYPTAEVNEGGQFVDNFIHIIGKRLKKSPSPIKKVGIGIPGTISVDRSTILEVPNIPTLNGIQLTESLQKAFPEVKFYLENDANAAALGEYYFGEASLPPNFLFITLGTGVGGGAIINGKVFKGGEGNGLEIGHIISSSGQTIEENIGKKGILRSAESKLPLYPGSVLHHIENLDAKAVTNAALEGDPLATEVFREVGKYLGEVIVSTVRILDTKTILVGGGISKTYHLLEAPMKEVIHHYLTPYYTNDLQIEIATLGNNAGILGAASLCK